MTNDGGEATSIRLIKAADVPIRRHVKIRATANPFDPVWDSYFAKRQSLPSGRETTPSGNPHVLPITGTDGSGQTGL